MSPLARHTINTSVVPGMLRTARLAIAKRWPWPVPARLPSGRRMYVDLRSGIGRGIFATGQFDPAVFEPIRAALRPGGTFLDVGANVGFYSMLALDVVGRTGDVHAFEIDERPLRCLRKTIAREALTNLVLHEVAVGREDGTARVAVREDSGHTGIDAGAAGPEVRVVALDSWWRETGVTNVQAIKIDIEGAEGPALQGARELLCAMRPVIVCEADEALQRPFGYGLDDLQHFLRGIGYRTRSLEDVWSPTIVATPG
jgi:FkbM family methyltransferase